MRFLISVCSTVVLVSCATTATVAGFGETTSGLPVSGTYTQSPDTPETFKIDLTFVSADGLRCSSSTSVRNGKAPWTFPTTCSEGVTGRATLTPNYATARDTVIYTLSNGERGSILFGGSTVSQPPNASMNEAAYALGCALGGGSCSPSNQQTIRVETDVTCRETTIGVRCRSY